MGYVISFTISFCLGWFFGLALAYSEKLFIALFGALILFALVSSLMVQGTGDSFDWIQLLVSTLSSWLGMKIGLDMGDSIFK
jgi:hypothetical protein